MAVQERVQEPRVQEAHGVTERVRRLREEAIQERAPVEVIYQMNQLLDILEG